MTTKAQEKNAAKAPVETPEAQERIALAERQDAIGAQLRGDAPDRTAVDLDREFQANWQKQQEQAYPELYRKAAALRGQQPSAQSGAPLALGAAASLVPGHDPAKFEEYRQAVEAGEAGAATAGSDNLPPHETTGGGTAIPTGVVGDSSLDPH